MLAPISEVELLEAGNSILVPVSQLRSAAGVLPESEVKNYCDGLVSLATWLERLSTNRSDKERIEEWSFWAFHQQENEWAGVAITMGVPKDLYWLWMVGETLSVEELHSFVKDAGIKFDEFAGPLFWSPEWKKQVARCVKNNVEEAMNELANPRLMAGLMFDTRFSVDEARVPAADAPFEEDAETQCPAADDCLMEVDVVSLCGSDSAPDGNAS